MDEKAFIRDMWDVLCGNTQYITQEQFIARYRDYFVYADCDERTIHLADDHNEWRIFLQKTWTDETNS